MTLATLRQPTGFSDPSHNESEVTILGFVYGKHSDASGYNRFGECTLAIVAKGSRVVSVPIDWLRLPTPPASKGTI